MLDSLSLDSSTSRTTTSQATSQATSPTTSQAVVDRDADRAPWTSPIAVCLDDAAQVDEGRRTSAMTNLYEALFFSLSVQDQRWVLDVVARHLQAEREAEARGETLAGPAW